MVTVAFGVRRGRPQDVSAFVVGIFTFGCLPCCLELRWQNDADCFVRLHPHAPTFPRKTLQSCCRRPDSIGLNTLLVDVRVSAACFAASSDRIVSWACQVPLGSFRISQSLFFLLSQKFDTIEVKRRKCLADRL